ncbi:hypothetical protein KAU09_01320 [Candidatus Parcubacteria bacterium]|nr:hypothetical protein [Candidatus Parcubacteria bacterium]
MLVAIISTIIAWGGFIAVLAILRKFIVIGITSGAIYIFANGGDSTLNRLIVRHLTDKDVSARELYDELRLHFEKDDRQILEETQV